jgi:hypothetical protein
MDTVAYYDIKLITALKSLTYEAWEKVVVQNSRGNKCKSEILSLTEISIQAHCDMKLITALKSFSIRALGEGSGLELEAEQK